MLGREPLEPASVGTLKLNPVYGTEMPDIFNGLVPVMSDRLLAPLAEAGVHNIDAYAVILERLDNGQQSHDYKVVNVIGKIDAIDVDRSTFYGSRLLPGFTSLTLKPEAIGDARCFLLKKEGGLVVNESVAEVLRRHPLVGVLLQPIEDFDGV